MNFKRYTGFMVVYLFRNLKHHYLEGKRVRRLDKSISALMKMVYNMQFERIIAKFRGELRPKMTALRKRHEMSKEINSLISEKIDFLGKKFIIQSSYDSDISLYEIRKLMENCDCMLHCQECKVCVHEISCTCYDYSISNNLCKHIHYIAQNCSFNTETIENNDITLVINDIPNSKENDVLVEEICEKIEKNLKT